jgi:hypothetical protein
MTADTRLLALVTNAIGFGFCLCLWAITSAGIALIGCLLTGALVMVCVEREQRAKREVKE